MSNPCFDCGYMWAPCEQDKYDEYEDYETDEYLDWLYSADYDEVPTFEEYGAPYDYQEFQKGVTMERIVRVWIGNDYVEYEIEDNGGWTEDELYEAIVKDVYDSISIEVL